jgi:hypothetical protein
MTRRGWKRDTAESGHATRATGEVLERDHVFEVPQAVMGTEAQTRGNLTPLVSGQVKESLFLKWFA